MWKFKIPQIIVIHLYMSGINLNSEFGKGNYASVDNVNYRPVEITTGKFALHANCKITNLTFR